MSEIKNWRFCAVGNIVAQHVDADGKILYGTRAFSGGTKVYINDFTYGLNPGRITVIGQNRHGRIATESVPNDLIENVREQRIFCPRVLKVMDYLEIMDGWTWRRRTAKDKREVQAFVNRWNDQEFT